MNKENVFTNERGYFFIFTLLLITLISVIGFGLMTVTKNTLKITTHERADQSVFYIAEADLNVKRAKIISELELAVLMPILDRYNEDEEFDIMEKKNLDKITLEYLDAAEIYLTKDLALEDGNLQKKYSEESDIYEEQNGLSPSSQVTLIKSVTNNYTLKSVGTIGEVSRTVSQDFKLKMPDLKVKDDGNNNDTTNINVCYGVLAQSFTTPNHFPTNADILALEDLTFSNTGTFEKNIYARGNVTITNTADVKGDILAFGDVNIKNASKELNNIYAKGKVNFTNTATVMGNVVALSDISFSNGVNFKKNIISEGNIIASQGSPKIEGNIFSKGDINFQVGVIANGFLYADQNFLNSHNDTQIQGVVFGKTRIESINAKKLGSIRFSMGDISYKNDTNNIFANNETEFNQYIKNNIPDFDNYLQEIEKLRNTKGNSTNTDSGCSTQSLANATIPNTPNFLNVDTSTFLNIPDINLGWNTNNELELVDNTYIKKLSLNYLTYTIDVGETDKTLVIDEFNGGSGHIEVKGKGKLNIIVNKSLKNLKLQKNTSSNRTPFDTTIYYDGTEKLEISRTVESNLYTKNSDITIINATGGGMQGNIVVGGNDKKLTVTGNVTFGIKDKSNVVILAPNSKIELSGSAYLYGTIIAKTVVGYADSVQVYDKSKLNLDLFIPSNKSRYEPVGNFLNSEPQKEI